MEAHTIETRKLRHDWTNILFIGFVHLAALVALVYLATVRFSGWTIGLGVLWFAFCGLAITGGYHRLFSHRTYKTGKALRAFYLFFGAAAVQNSALKWCSDHRRHHSQTDRDGDPYNITRGFFWAHIGWIFFISERQDVSGVKDLQADPLVRFQDRYYVPLAIGAAIVLPGLLGLLWGDPLGAVLVAGFLRLAIQWHATFAVNSIAHMWGKRPFSTTTSARDSFLTAMITLGEGYHNFHHKFQADYRNGIRWYQLDPTKWFVWTLSKVGLTWDLRRTPKQAIVGALQAVRDETAEALRGPTNVSGAGRS